MLGLFRGNGVFCLFNGNLIAGAMCCQFGRILTLQSCYARNESACCGCCHFVGDMVCTLRQIACEQIGRRIEILAVERQRAVPYVARKLVDRLERCRALIGDCHVLEVALGLYNQLHAYTLSESELIRLGPFAIFFYEETLLD